MVSFGAIQGFLDPMTPLGQSTIRTSFSDILRKAGFDRTSSYEDAISSNSLKHNIIKSSANRLYFDITGILTSPVGRSFGLSRGDIGMGKIIDHLNRPELFPQKPIISSIKTIFGLLFFIIPLLFRSIRNFIFPRYAKRLFVNQMEKYHQFVDQGFNDENNRTLTDCVKHFTHVLSVLPLMIARYGAPCILPAIISLKRLEKLAKNPIDVLALTRAVESNPTTEMNLRLWKLTVLIRENHSILQLFENQTTMNLVQIYQRKLFDKEIQEELETFFRVYGCRGVGEIDIGRPRWVDQPEVVIEQIKNYLKIINPEKAIGKIHEQSQQSAYEALNRIENQLEHPWIQRPWLHFLFHRLRILFSLRECPKFDGLIQTFWKCRRELFHKAQLAVKENFISRIDDISFLYIDELQRLAFDTDHKQYEKISFWKNLISQRRAEYNKQMFCKRIPIVLLSDGTTYYDATTIPTDSKDQMELPVGEFLGTPVSPGVYEGKVRIVDDPMNSQLQPGEILVCTATDPAWTSLFPIVGALVLEMGGMLQHGAIVSREYGLPAVVGVANAKEIFHNGDVIEVNGSNGRIKVLSNL